MRLTLGKAFVVAVRGWPFTMFENSSIYADFATEPLEKGDIFYGWELGGWQIDRRTIAIFAISAALNLLFLVFLGRTHFLTARGCDSPFVGRVCEVLDMAYVGNVLFGTERDYIDAEYERLDLKDSEIIWIDQTGAEPPFTYPEGYFALSNPESVYTNSLYPQAGSFPPVPVTPIPEPSLKDTPQRLPKKNPNPIEGDLPDSPFEMADGDSASNKKPGAANSANNAVNGKTPDANTTANANSNTGTGVDGIEINKRPLADYGNLVNGLIAEKNINLEGEFQTNAKGRLTKDGRIDPKTLKIEVQSVDPQMQVIVREGISAIDASGYLKYLSVLSGRDFEMSLLQDKENLTAVIQSEMESETRANSTKSTLDLLLAAAKMSKNKENASQNDKDDLILLEGAKIETIGKKIIIKFVVPKAVVHPMIKRKLAEQAAEMQNQQKSGSISSTNSGKLQ
ncbi:MAG TPA: hypothetical protein VNK26_02190 [Pyrinomonadaceae bacterium]|nr:hypothetical protein [Pyrinomonadaceae bacterium]